MSRRGRYPKEFKLEAVQLLNEGGKPASEIAMQLGVKRTLLYRWRDELDQKGEKAFPGAPCRFGDDPPPHTNIPALGLLWFCVF